MDRRVPHDVEPKVIIWFLFPLRLGRFRVARRDSVRESIKVTRTMIHRAIYRRNGITRGFTSLRLHNRKWLLRMRGRLPHLAWDPRWRAVIDCHTAVTVRAFRLLRYGGVIM